MKRKRIPSLLLILFVYSITFSQELTKKEITAITDQIPLLITENYVLTEKRAAISTAMLQKVRSKKYLKIVNPDSLAKTLTKDLREVSNDRHLYVNYLKSGEKNEAPNWDLWEKEERALEKKLNFGFTEVKIFEENIGYLKIVEFMHPQRGMQTAVAAMKFVENTDGLIIDLRGNGGGYPGLMQYILNHYFEGAPTHISTTFYSEKDKIPTKEYSSDLVYGNLRVHTPLYIITDKKTGSAAEFFAYTLQSFGKAKIIGNRTAGAAHMNSFYKLDENFKISISTGAPINPNTKTNWETLGVVPDFVVKENELKSALKLIKKEVTKIASEK